MANAPEKTAVPPLLTSDVARRLGCTGEWVRRLERAGHLHATKSPSGVRVFKLADVERLARERDETRSHRR
jgi:DNA-binding transcriptional MerR regulator